jgi:hypothetical protein
MHVHASVFVRVVRILASHGGTFLKLAVHDR